MEGYFKEEDIYYFFITYYNNKFKEVSISTLALAQMVKKSTLIHILTYIPDLKRKQKTKQRNIEILRSQLKNDEVRDKSFLEII